LLTTTAAQTLSLVTGDRGCIPGLKTGVFTGAAAAVAVAAVAGTPQTAGSAAGGGTPWGIGSAAGTTAVIAINDMNTILATICTTYGTCCYTTNCNSAELVKFNLIALIFTVIISIIFF